MNLMLRLSILLALGFIAPAGTLLAQDDDSSPAPAAGTTVIKSDELRMDQINHVAVFSGKVIVTGSSFTMTCDEMTVNFTTDNKIDNIVAKGNVIILQPGRVTHSGKAQYFRDDDKFVLTDNPSIDDNKKKVSAPVITIYRTKGLLTTDGRTTTELPPDSSPAPSGNPAPDSNLK